MYINIMLSGLSGLAVIAEGIHWAEDGLSPYQGGKLTLKCIQRHSSQRKQLVDLMCACDCRCT